MAITRRSLGRGLLLGAAGAMLAGRYAHAQSNGDLRGDDGNLVDALRLPVELTGGLERLPGILWLGSKERAFTLYEFYDYNCPYCRKAVNDVHRLLTKMPDLRIGLVNDAILSIMSVQAAKVHLALLQLKGPAITDQFHRMLLNTPGTNDGARAIKVAVELGADQRALEEIGNSDGILNQLKAQHRAATNLGLIATPSFVAGTTGILGYPGPKTIERVLDAIEH